MWLTAKLAAYKMDIIYTHKHHSSSPYILTDGMESYGRCKGCKTYLSVPPGQPCSICYTINKPNKRVPQLLNYIDGYLNRPSNNNYNSPQPVQAPIYAGYNAPQVGYYSPPPLRGTAVYGYGYGYDRPNPQMSYPLMNNNYIQQSPPVHVKKRAVLCGVTYKGHRKTLTASINNVRSMHQLLLKMGFPNACIHVLTEDETDPTMTPTRRNILRELEWLNKGSRSGDSLVFYYAGHGSHVPDGNGDEKDGFDEAICPVDYRESGKILDDDVNAILVAPLPHGAILHSIMDTCFSGTLLDLPFLCRIDQRGFYKWEDHHPSHVLSHGGTRGGKAISISACDDDQNSADTSAFTGNAIGVLTYSFIQAVQSSWKLTYGDLLDNMRKVVLEAQQRQGLNASFATSTSQEPQLSCSTKFEIYSEPFML